MILSVPDGALKLLVGITAVSVQMDLPNLSSESIVLVFLFELMFGTDCFCLSVEMNLSTALCCSCCSCRVLMGSCCCCCCQSGVKIFRINFRNRRKELLGRWWSDIVVSVMDRLGTVVVAIEKKISIVMYAF